MQDKKDNTQHSYPSSIRLARARLAQLRDRLSFLGKKLRFATLPLVLLTLASMGSIQILGVLIAKIAVERENGLSTN